MASKLMGFKRRKRLLFRMRQRPHSGIGDRDENRVVLKYGREKGTEDRYGRIWSRRMKVDCCSGKNRKETVSPMSHLWIIGQEHRGEYIALPRDRKREPRRGTRGNIDEIK